MRIAGHSNIQMSSRYVHPGGDAVMNAMRRMQTESLQNPLHRGNPELQFPANSLKNYGERGWTRTIDPCLKRALLCQLSYAPVFGK